MKLVKYLSLAKEQYNEMATRIPSSDAFVEEIFPGYSNAEIPLAFIRSVQSYQPLREESYISTTDLEYQLTRAEAVLQVDGEPNDELNGSDAEDLENYYGIGTCQRLAQDIMRYMNLKTSNRAVAWNMVCKWLVDSDAPNSPYGISYRKQTAA